MFIFSNQVRTKYLVVAVVFLGCLLGWSSVVVFAQDEVVFEHQADYFFGQQVEFVLIVPDGVSVDTATLFFTSPDLAQTFVVTVDPGRDQTYTHIVPLTQVRLAPFTTVTYWWNLVVDGEDIFVPEQTFDYIDDRFAWQQLSQDGTIVYWASGDATVGQAALDVVANARPGLEAIIPTPVPDPLRIFIYPSTADLRASLRLTGRDWVAAHAEPELGVILTTAINPRTATVDLGRTIPHELTHLMLYNATEAGYENIPRWFDEGLASHFEAFTNPTYETIVQQAALEERVIPLRELCVTFPAGEEQALLAYAQSFSAIQYIQSQYGNNSLSDMIRAFANGAGCESVTERVLDMTLDEFTDNWLGGATPESPINLFFQENALWLLLISAGFVMTILLIRPVQNEQEN